MKIRSLAQASFLFVLLLAMSSGAYASDTAFQAGDHTVALWNFGEGSAGTALDQDRSGMVLEPQSNENQEPLQEVDGKFGKALFFPGNASLISVSGGPVATPDQVTLEVWMKLDSAGESTVRGVFQHMQHGLCGFRMEVDSRGYLIWMTQDGTQEVSLTSTLVVPPDEWVHVAGTYDGTAMRIFINGEQDSELPVENINPQGSGPLYVGLTSSNPPPYFRGAIQAIRISDVALTNFDLK